MSNDFSNHASHPTAPAPQVYECRAMLTLPDANTMLAGDRNGAVKIFQWKAPPMTA
jgi:hypothetical protein